MAVSYAEFAPLEPWLDDQGKHINAHGGGVMFHDGRYYWFGEHKREGWEGRLAHDGVHCYSSSDLYNWRDEGIVLPVVDDPQSPIVRGCRIERPKVLRAPETGKFVMWWHSTDVNHQLARSGVAVADSVTGPYRLLGARRPNAGRWPINARAEHRDALSIAAAKAEPEWTFNNGRNDRVPQFNILGRDVEGGQMARDMNLFQDTDGIAYHLYASEHNSTLHIAELSADRLEHVRFARVFEHRWMEAPAMFRAGEHCFLLMSDCTSWDPNAARSAVSKTPLGPWRELGNPCVGVNPQTGQGPELTFGCQSTCVFPVQGRKNAFIAMFDYWNPKNFIDSRYVWLPVTIESSGRFEIVWRDRWSLSVFDQ